MFTKESEQKYSLSRPALIFVEGQHTDNKKRVHVFGRERVEELVRNTNAFLDKGGRLPFQRDHKKTQEFNLGDVESNLYTKEITADDLPNPKHKHLIGRLGVFVDKITAKGKHVVDQLISKSISTLSPGIDPETKMFAEISATPLPAIIGPGILFSQFGEGMDTDEDLIVFQAMEESKPSASPVIPAAKPEIPVKAVSFEDLYAGRSNKEATEEKYYKLSNDLFLILSSLTSMSDEELQAKGVENPIQSAYDALEYFFTEVEETFQLVRPEDEEDPLDEEEEDQDSNSDNPVGGDPNKNMTKKAAKSAKTSTAKFSRAKNNLISY